MVIILSGLNTILVRVRAYKVYMLYYENFIFDNVLKSEYYVNLLFKIQNIFYIILLLRVILNETSFLIRKKQHCNCLVLILCFIFRYNSDGFRLRIDCSLNIYFPF